MKTLSQNRPWGLTLDDDDADDDFSNFAYFRSAAQIPS
jgi:hypothetical protein